MQRDGEGVSGNGNADVGVSQPRSRVAGLFWSGSVNSFKTGGDVGNVQVRTHSRKDYDLIVRENDRDEDIFVLVIGKTPEYRVVGWTCGADTKRPAWRKAHGNRPAAYFVPQKALRPLPSPMPP